MKVCGIIAEYNPFHSGHAYQIQQARKASGCDYVIVIMSGDFVQRGAPALTEKYTRARMALLGGADLVLMLPVYGSTASAEGFAQAGIAALLTTGVVDSISFGCEDPSICCENYRHLARELMHETTDFRSTLADCLCAGMPYAQARTEAIRICHLADFDLGLLESPNNLLAFEYLRALEFFQTDLQIFPIRRLGSYHDTACPARSQMVADDRFHVPFSSASACRKHLLLNHTDGLRTLEHNRQIPSEICTLLGDYTKKYSFLQENDLSQMLHYALLSQKDIGYEQFLDCGRDLSARIGNLLDQYLCFSQFCDVLKNKSLTHTRIARALTHILLQLPATMPAPFIGTDGVLPYLRVLGFRKSAAPLLHAVKQHSHAPLITRIASAFHQLPPESLEYMKQDLFAAEMYQSMLLHKCGKRGPDDYRRTIEII